MTADVSILIWINQGWADPGLDFLFGWVSERASFSLPLLLLLLYFLWRHFQSDGVKLWLLMVFAVLMGDMLGNLLKSYFAMPRPCFDLFELLRPPGGGAARQCQAPSTGMPSSHALNFFATTAFLAYAIRLTWLNLTLLFIALLVGLSRIYLAKHYPHQVLTGASIGAVFGFGVAWLGLRSFNFGQRFLNRLQTSDRALDEKNSILPPWFRAGIQRALFRHPASAQRKLSINSPIVLAPLLFAILAAMLVWLGGWNTALFTALNQLGPMTSNALWANFTLLGDTLIAFVLLTLFARHRPDIVGAVFIAALFATLYVQSLKHLLDLSRPLAILGPEQVHVIGQALRSHSFPSGHTTTAFTLAGVIILRGIHPALGGVIFLLALLAAISRVAVGAHWPVDILAGMLGGWLSAALGVLLAQHWRPQKTLWLQRLMPLFFLTCALALLSVRGLGYPQAIPLQMLIGIMGVGASLNLFRKAYIHPA